MSTWYIKELSEITGLTVQTLHHYDRINLLKPSICQLNGYRLYSETDLSRVQRIIALKSFGFKLRQIKEILVQEGCVGTALEIQEKILEEKARDIQNTLKIMKSVTSTDGRGPIPWKKTIELIEVYKMTQNLENKWISDVLYLEEMKDYKSLKENYMAQFSEAEQKSFKERWAKIIRDAQYNIDQDPRGPIGIKIGAEFMQWVHEVYPPEYASVRKSIWEKGFKMGHADASEDVVQWISKSLDAYWRYRIYTTLDHVKDPVFSIVEPWEKIMHEMCGDSKEESLVIVGTAIVDENVSEVARK